MKIGSVAQALLVQRPTNMAVKAAEFVGKRTAHHLGNAELVLHPPGAKTIMKAVTGNSFALAQAAASAPISHTLMVAGRIAQALGKTEAAQILYRGGAAAIETVAKVHEGPVSKAAAAVTEKLGKLIGSK